MAVPRECYSFSVDELVAICIMERINVAVFKEVRGALTFVDGWFDGVGPVVCTKLIANSDESVRSHFERLLIVEECQGPVSSDHARKRRRPSAEFSTSVPAGEASLTPWIPRGSVRSCVCDGL